MRTLSLLALLGALGCARGALKGAGDDTGAPRDAGADSAAPDTGDAPAGPDFSRFTGAVTLSVDSSFDAFDCGPESADEVGAPPADARLLADAQAACPSCTQIHEVLASPDTLCEVPLPRLRGLRIDGAFAEVYAFFPGDAGLEAVQIDDDARFDGVSVDWVGPLGEDFTSEAEAYGSFTFPPLGSP
jgi:hypothetical protein